MFRRSKFKHVFGKPKQRDSCYDNIRITKSSWDSMFCSVNPKFLAVITEAAGGGSFLVLPIEKFGRIERDAPLVAGHKAAVLDIQWCPFNDNLIASASEDCTVKVWEIPDEGIQAGENLTEPVADLVAHQRRVGLVQWHPTAENVLLSAGGDNMVFIWNVATQEVMVEIAFPDMILSASFNYNGSRFACTCKDRKTRVVDPRSGSILAEGSCHDGNKPQRVVYLKNGRILTTGFSKMSERQIALWSDDNLSESLQLQELDSSNGVLFPFYDPDTNVLFLCGKGDTNIRYFEIADEQPYLHFLSMYSSSEPQRGIGFMPKRALDVNANEIVRFYKLHTKGLCEVIPFTVPRKSELFQDDLYPDTASGDPAMSPEEWFGGHNKDPILMSLKDGFVSKTTRSRPLISKPLGSQTKNGSSAAPPAANNVHSKEANVKHSETTPTSNTYSSDLSRNGHSATTSAADSASIQSLQGEVKRLNELVQSLLKRVETLEVKQAGASKSVPPAPVANSGGKASSRPEEDGLLKAVDKLVSSGQVREQQDDKDNLIDWED